MNFDTYFFDDELKVEAYQKNSTIKTNQIGKGIINLKDACFDSQTTLIGLPVVNKRLLITVGYMYFRVVYQPR